MAGTAFLVLTVLALSLIAHTKAQNDEWWIIKSELDGRVITTTDILQSGGTYEIYHTVALEDNDSSNQRWSKDLWFNGTVVLNSRNEQRYNTVSTFKYCENCIASSEIWHNSLSGSANETTTLRSDSTHNCLANPGGDGFLYTGNCDYTDTRQIWRFILAN